MLKLVFNLQKKTNIIVSGGWRVLNNIASAVIRPTGLAISLHHYSMHRVL